MNWKTPLFKIYSDHNDINAVTKIIKRGNFDRRQMAFIMHYVMCLDGMTDDEMYQLHSWQCFKISQSQATQIVLKQIGKSAEQLALAKLERIVEKIADDKEIAIELKEEKKEK